MSQVLKIKKFIAWLFFEVFFKFKLSFLVFISLLLLSVALEGLTLILISGSNHDLIVKLKTTLGLIDFDLSHDFIGYLGICICIWCISFILNYFSGLAVLTLWRKTQIECANNILRGIKDHSGYQSSMISLINRLQHLGALVKVACNAFSPIIRFIVFTIILMGMSSEVTLIGFSVLIVMGGSVLLFMARSSSIATREFYNLTKDNSDEIKECIASGSTGVGPVYIKRIDLLLKRFNRAEQMKVCILMMSVFLLLALVLNSYWISLNEKVFIVYLITFLVSVKQLANISSIFTTISRYYPSFLEYEDTRKGLLNKNNDDKYFEDELDDE